MFQYPFLLFTNIITMKVTLSTDNDCENKIWHFAITFYKMSTTMSGRNCKKATNMIWNAKLFRYWKQTKRQRDKRTVLNDEMVMTLKWTRQDGDLNIYLNNSKFILRLLSSIIMDKYFQNLIHFIADRNVTSVHFYLFYFINENNWF